MCLIEPEIEPYGIEYSKALIGPWGLVTGRGEPPAYADNRCHPGRGSQDSHMP